MHDVECRSRWLSRRALLSDVGQRNVGLCGRYHEGLQLICKVARPDGTTDAKLFVTTTRSLEGGMTTGAPRVFVSYLHDIEPHKDWVLTLATG